jgi:hypothetical protein
LHKGNLLQQLPVDHAMLKNFFFNYGPSARNCYMQTTSEKAFETFQHDLMQAVAYMTWDELDKFISQQQCSLANDAPFFIALISPNGKDRTGCHVTIISCTIMQLLWKAHGRPMQGYRALPQNVWESENS